MLGIVSKVRDALEGNENKVGKRIQSDTRSESATADTSASLFHCPSCETVYIAEEKAECSGCGVAVEAVPSEFR